MSASAPRNALLATLRALLITQTWACAHAPAAPPSHTDIRTGPERCTLPLINTQEVIGAILHDLSTFYTAVNGAIIKIERVEGRYEVWVSHNERIDVLIFEATATPTCEVTIHRTGERTVDR
jgi:hypothetical protein